MLIQNGMVATERGGERLDVRVEGERIEQVAAGLVPRAGEYVIDAGGQYVLPGGVDVHTHMDLDLGDVRSTDDFYSGTVAAAFGGTTTIVDHMAFGPRGCSIRRQVDAYHALADARAVVDYGFHGVFDHVDEGIEREMAELIDEGITSHKIYLTYGGKLCDRDILRVLQRAAALGVMICAHAENDGAIERLRAQARAAGQTQPIMHARTRPAEAEAEAVARLCYLARIAGDAPLYIVHLSSDLGLRAIEDARARGQRRVFAETCPQYLFLDERLYLREDGLKFVMSPPLRTAFDVDALWAGLLRGSMDTVATDHCPFFYALEKQMGRRDALLAPGGAPGVEMRMTLLFGEVLRGRLPLSDFVRLTASGPARRFGLYPRKGAIRPGSDADIVVFDPRAARTIERRWLHENTDYTPYEGMEALAWPVMTVLRGRIIARDGQFLGARGGGRYVRRGMPDLVRP